MKLIRAGVAASAATGMLFAACAGAHDDDALGDAASCLQENTLRFDDGVGRPEAIGAIVAAACDVQFRRMIAATTSSDDPATASLMARTFLRSQVSLATRMVRAHREDPNFAAERLSKN